MANRRFYYPLDLEGNLTLKDQYYNYIKNVLRLVIGDEVHILNERFIGSYIISDIKKGSIVLCKNNIRPLKGASYKLTLYQSILKKTYMDNVIEKTAELGITKLIPVYTERSLQYIKESTIQRFKELLIKGAIQAEMEYIPKLCDPINIYEINPETIQNFLFYERCEKKCMPEVKQKDISVFIGPEGGLTEKEVSFLEESNFQIISPTKSILKAETAAIVFVGLIKFFLESL